MDAAPGLPGRSPIPVLFRPKGSYLQSSDGIWCSSLGMTASRQWRERTSYLFCGGFQGGRDRRGMEYSPPKITVKRASWARGLRPRPQFAPSQGGKGFRGGGRISAQVFFPLSFLLSLSPSLDSDPGPLALFCRPQGPNFFAGENILAGPKYFVFGGKARQGKAKGFGSGVGWENLWDGEAESQWIVAARLLCHLQYLVPYLSRLQRIHLPDRLELWCKAPGDGSFGRPGGALDACFWGRTGRP